MRPLTIGWKEYVSFPEWSIRYVKAKVDTGARTSAIDVVRYQLLEGPDANMLEMLLALDRKRAERTRLVRVPFLGMVQVRNTGGRFECRPLVETTITIGPVTKRARLTVTDRSAMCFRIILGREVLKGDFVVDVSQKYLLRSPSTGGRGAAAL